MIGKPDSDEIRVPIRVRTDRFEEALTGTVATVNSKRERLERFQRAIQQLREAVLEAGRQFDEAMSKPEAVLAEADKREGGAAS